MTFDSSRYLSFRAISPFYNVDKGDGGGGGGAGGDKVAGAGDGKNADGSTITDDKSGGDKGDKSDPDPKPKKVVTVEIEGKQYVLQDHVNQLVGDARTEGERKGVETAEQTAARKALEAQGDFKKLYETEKTNRETAERERDDERLNTLRREIGEKYGLSAKLSLRLAGKTAKEIDADAKELAEEQGIELGDKVTKRVAPSTEGGNGSKVRQKTGGDKGGSGGDDDKSKTRKRPFAFQTEGDVKRWE